MEIDQEAVHRQLVLTALRVLADEAVRGSNSDRVDELALRNASDDADRLLPIRQLARRIIGRESQALGWRMLAGRSEVSIDRTGGE
jgi:hypothetical protein